MKTILRYLKDNKVTLPSGILSPARFQQLGILFGMHGRDSILIYTGHVIRV